MIYPYSPHVNQTGPQKYGAQNNRYNKFMPKGQPNLWK